MKKTLLLTVFFWPVLLFAQNNASMPLDKGQWIDKVEILNSENGVRLYGDIRCYYYKATLKKKTINDKEYNIIKYGWIKSDTSYKLYDTLLARIDQKKVYFRYSTKDYLVYDFSKNQGDTGFVEFPGKGIFKYKVTKKYTSSSSNRSSFEIKWIDKKPYGDYYGFGLPSAPLMWHEGVGSNYGFQYWNQFGAKKTETAVSNYRKLALFVPNQGKISYACNPHKVGIKQIETNPIKIYPNPTRDNITVERTKNLPVLFMLFKNTGQLVYSKKITGAKIRLQLPELAKGFYFYKIGNETVGKIQIL